MFRVNKHLSSQIEQTNWKSLFRSIFAGTVVMVNYFLMMTWIPACVSINERISCYAVKWWVLALTKVNTAIGSVAIQTQDRIIFLVVGFPYFWMISFGI